MIGPNGAGKSTLFDLITGFQRARRRPHPCSTASPSPGCAPTRSAAAASAAPSRSSSPSRGMTVLENVMVGAFQKTADPRRARADGRAERSRASASPTARDAHARVLSTGQRKRLEMARALATARGSCCSTRSPAAWTSAASPAWSSWSRQLHAGGTRADRHRAQHAGDHGDLPADRRARTWARSSPIGSPGRGDERRPRDRGVPGARVCRLSPLGGGALLEAARPRRSLRRLPDPLGRAPPRGARVRWSRCSGRTAPASPR